MILIAIAALAASIFVGAGQASAEYEANPATGQWQIDGEIVYAITRLGDRIYAGGSFNGAVSPTGTITPQANLLSFNADTGAFESGFTPDIVGTVQTLASSTDGSVLYVGGKFTMVNGVARNSVVALDPTTGATIATFIADTQAGSTVYDLEAHNEHVYIAGVYQKVNDIVHRRLARVDAATGVLDTTWVPTPDSRVDDMAIPPAGDRLYAVGQFKNMDDQYTNSVAAVDLVTGDTVPGFDATFINQSRAVDATDDRVVVNHRQGNFVSVLDASGNLIRQIAGDGDFQEVEIVGRRAMIGSHSRTFDGLPMRRLQSLHLDDGSPSDTLDTPVQGWPGVFAIYASGSDLWVGGKIFQAGTTNADRIVRIGIDPAQSGPTEPTAVTTTGLTTGEIELNWTAATDDTGIAGYRILRGGIQVGWVTSGTTWTDSSVVPGVNYVYNIETVDIDDNLSTRTADLFEVGPAADTTPPDPPTTVTVTSTNATSASLTWTAGTDNIAVTDYEVLRDGIAVGTTGGPTLTFVDTGLTPSTTYNYEIRALDAAGNVSIESAPPVPATTADASTIPTAPTGVAVLSTTETTVELKWDAATDDVAVTDYEILRDGIAVGTTGGPTLTYTDTGLDPATTYNYEVRALDGDGNVSPESAPPVPGLTVTDTVAPSTPGTPTLVAATGTQIELTWAASTDNVAVTDYEVLRDGIVVGTTAGPTTTFVDTGLTPLTSYSYEIRALDAAANVSPLSPAGALSTIDDIAPTAPGAPVIVSTTETMIDLSWAPSTDNVAVTSYEVLRDGVVVGTATTEVFSDAGLIPGTSYDYTVRALDAAGNVSVESLISTGTTAGDLVDPNGTLTNPVAGSTVPTPVVFDGDATDDIGVGSVEVAIKNLIVGDPDYKLWLQDDLVTWGSYNKIDATLATPGATATTWTYTANLADGEYGVSVVTTDLAGNQDPTKPWVKFDVSSAPPDTVAPNGTLTTPTAGSLNPSPVVFDGDATDDIGVGSVEVAIKNLIVGDPDYKLWLQDDLVTWGAYNKIDATLATPGATATTWTYSVALADGDEYGVSVITTDLAGNQDPTKPWVKFEVSSAPPDTVIPDPGVIINPTANQVLTGLSHLFDGTASDDVGVGEVELLIKNTDTNQFLRVDGSYGSYERLPTTLGTPDGPATTWSATFDLTLTGNYWVKVIVTDTSGNESASPPPKTVFSVS